MAKPKRCKWKGWDKSKCERSDGAVCTIREEEGSRWGASSTVDMSKKAVGYTVTCKRTSDIVTTKAEARKVARSL